MNQRKHIILGIIFIFAVMLVVRAQTTIEPIHWSKLTPFLIDLDGWEADGDAQGQTMNMMGTSVTVVDRDYTKNDMSLTITITDSGYVQMVMAGIQMMMQFEVDSSEEYVKKVTVGDFAGVETYNYEDKDAKLILVLKDRFLVQLEGEGFEKDQVSELVAIAGSLDLNGIAALAK
ncbi:MAG: hypothetical protein KKD56_05400 [Acidobacteria bacterium]|nr:hypothetical protein [Acidobacteriota bacterium]MBU1475297.1 hypothetical protein [Acidobacteriota bacterium]MBU4255532.1 hypothetical protein [Acidobacteriota bacterium]